MSIFRELARQFAAPTWNRGVQLQMRDAVVSLRWDRQHDTWHARVRGSAPQPYAVWVFLDDTHAGLELDGECTCPADKPCKHIAAVAIEALEREIAELNQAVAPRRVPERAPTSAFTAWAARLTDFQPVARTPTSTAQKRRLVWTIEIETPVRGDPRPRVAITTHGVTLRKSGSEGTTTPYDLASVVWRTSRERPTWIDDADFVLWFRLGILLAGDRSLERFAGTRLWLPHCPEAAELFADIVATGRCRLFSPDGPTLRRAPPRAGRVRWLLEDDGTQELRIAIDGAGRADDCLLLPLVPPHFVDMTTGECGAIELDVPAAIAPWLLAAPRCPPEEAVRLPAAIAVMLDAAGVPRPRVLEEAPPRSPKPVPILHLYAPELDSMTVVGALCFDYDDIRVDAADPGPAIVRIEAGRVQRTLRDPTAESSARQRLRASGLGGDSRRLALVDADGWMAFGQDVVPTLRREGWRVEIDDDLPFFGVEVDNWSARTECDESGHDWFLDLGVTVAGERIDILPAIVAAIRSGRIDRERLRLDRHPVLLPLADGRRIALEPARLQTMLDVLVELHDPSALTGGRLRLGRLDVLRLDALADWTLDLAPRLQALAASLREGAARRTRVPAGLKATLREYQQRGLDWLQWLRRAELGAILADDMGLGKTVQALAHLLVEKRAGRLDRPALVVAPKSVLHNWLREAERFTPALRCAIYHGSERAPLLEQLDAIDVVVTTYALLQRDEALAAVHWRVALLDEAQMIKNPAAKVTLVAHSLRADQRICMTGTPMENNLGDLWSLMTFANPGLLGTAKQFTGWYRTPIEKDGEVGRFDALCRRIAPFMLRRTKAQVLAELPPKTEIVLNAELDGPQRDLYESVRMTMEERVRDELASRGLARSRIIVLDALLKLRQVCCHPGLVKVERARTVEHSAKLEVFMDLVRELVAEGRRTLVFSQFTEMLALIERELLADGIRYASITGKTQKRQAIVDEFQAGALPVLLVSLKAGGTGLNLTAADTVIHYDPWWNPAVEAQATDRAHRIGQDKPVTVVRLICAGTVEERIIALQQRKAALLRGIQDHAERRAAGRFALEEGDIAELLAPIGTTTPRARRATALDTE